MRYVLTDGGLQDQPRWSKIQDAMIEAMIRLERAMKPQLQRLKNG